MLLRKIGGIEISVKEISVGELRYRLPVDTVTRFHLTRYSKNRFRSMSICSRPYFHEPWSPGEFFDRRQPQINQDHPAIARNQANFQCSIQAQCNDMNLESSVWRHPTVLWAYDATGVGNRTGRPGQHNSSHDVWLCWQQSFQMLSNVFILYVPEPASFRHRLL